MSNECNEEGGQEAATSGPKGFAEMCASMMSAKPGEGCESRMREMMSRCVPNPSGGQPDPQANETKETVK